MDFGFGESDVLNDHIQVFGSKLGPRRDPKGGEVGGADGPQFGVIILIRVVICDSNVTKEESIYQPI